MAMRLIAVPYDGASRGQQVGAGPLRLLDDGLAEALEAERATVATTYIELPPNHGRGEIASAFTIAALLRDAVASAMAAGEFPLVLAGNCMAALGIVTGLGAPRVGTVWLDAHADFNTPETTTSGLLDGMALSTIVGHCWSGLLEDLRGFRRVAPRDVLLVGARDLDADEEIRLIEQGVRRHGGPRGWDGSVGSMVPDAPALYLHIDLDVLDPSEGRANRHAAADGLTVGYVIGIIGELRRTRRLRAASITSYDPAFDTDGRVSDAARRIAAALG